MDLPQPSLKIVRMRDLPPMTGIGTSTTYAKVAKGRFPKPIKLIPGGRAVGWRQSDIEEYLADPEAWVTAHSGMNGEVSK